MKLIENACYIAVFISFMACIIHVFKSPTLGMLEWLVIMFAFTVLSQTVKNIVDSKARDAMKILGNE